MRTLCDTAQAMIDSLTAKGITLTPSQVVRINALAHDVEAPPFRHQLAKGRPVSVGYVWLWPLTLAATAWHEATTHPDKTIALAYAMAHGHDKALDTATDKDVRAWARGIRATRAQVEIAVAEVLDQDAAEYLPTSPTDSPATFGQIVRFMLEAHGGTVEQWERNVSQGYIFESIQILWAQSCAMDKTADQLMRRKANVILMLEVDRIEKGSIQNG